MNLNTAYMPGGNASAVSARGDISSDSLCAMWAILMEASGENVDRAGHDAMNAQQDDNGAGAQGVNGAGGQNSNTNQGQIAVMKFQKAITDNSTLVSAASSSMSAVHDGVAAIVRNFK